MYVNTEYLDALLKRVRQDNTRRNIQELKGARAKALAEWDAVCPMINYKGVKIRSSYSASTLYKLSDRSLDILVSVRMINNQFYQAEKQRRTDLKMQKQIKLLTREWQTLFDSMEYQPEYLVGLSADSLLLAWRLGWISNKDYHSARQAIA